MATYADGGLITTSSTFRRRLHRPYVQLLLPLSGCPLKSTVKVPALFDPLTGLSPDATSPTVQNLHGRLRSHQLDYSIVVARHSACKLFLC